MIWKFNPFTLSLFLIVWVLTSSLCLKGQILKFDFDEYNTKHGLSQNQVLCIAQDKKGFMWFGTEEGLNRFDGYEFKVFKHAGNDANGIVSSTVRTLLVDDDGSIWIGTTNGICRFFPEQEFFQPYPVDFVDETKLNGSYVTSVQKKSDGSLWISYIGSGVDVIFPDQKEIFHYTIHRDDEYRLKNDMISSLQFMPDGDILLGSYEGIQVIDGKGVVMTEEKVSEKYPWTNLIHKSTKTMLLSRDGTTLWIGTDLNGVYKVDLATNSVHNFTTSNSEFESNDILTLYQDSKENIWVGSDAIYLFDEKQSRFRWYNEHGMYIKNHTNSIFEDKDFNLWIGTTRLGIRKINRRKTNVRHYHSNQGESSIRSDEVLAFRQDTQGNVWIAAAGAGLYTKRNGQDAFDESPVNAKLQSKVIKSIYQDDEGYFWMGGWDAGLIKYDPLHHTLEQYHPKDGSFGSHHVWDIKGDNKGNLWIGTLRDGLCYFSPKTKEYKYYQYSPDDSTGLVNNDVLSVYVDSRNILWVGTAYGLSVLFPEEKRFRNLFTFKSNDRYPITNNVIQTITEDTAGRIWLGTKGGGIVVINVTPDELKIEKIIKDTDGLPSNTITSLQPDSRNHIWAGSTDGLVKINIENLSPGVTPPDVALRGVDLLTQASFRLDNGQLLFGSSTGLYLFHPDSLRPPDELNIVFTSLKIVGEEISPGKLYRHRKVLEQSVTETEELNLTHEDYAFTISFSPLAYTNQNNLYYAFYLENLDKEWQYTQSDKRFVHYTNLEPGKYVLHVKASYDGVQWLEKSKTLVITISPPWWSTWWSKAGSMLFVGTVAFGIHKTRIRFLEKQSHKLERLVEQRTHELHHSNEEIQALLKEVAQQKEKIEIKNQELQRTNEEVHLQHDRLIEKSKELEKAQLDLRKINVSLEEQVNKRTQTLNETLLELETFLYRASHDLQGPVATLYGLIALAKVEMQASSSISHDMYYSMIESSVAKLETTLKKLMHKHSIQKTSVAPEPLHSNAIVRLIEKVISQIKEFREGDFEMTVAENIALKTDKSFLYIILYCLLENAFVYSRTSHNKKVCLSIHQNTKTLILDVTDFGVGINNELHDKIFTMFYRGSELSNGNGLGLYLVKNILDKLNGSIELQTEENRFSKFRVTIPSFS